MRFFRFSRTSHKETVTCSTAHGHFYSPVVDPAALRERQSLLWPEKPEVLGIDFNPGFHRQVLEDFFPKHLPHYDYPEEKPESDTQFFTRNSQFSWLDSRALFVLLREWQPAHMIEIGSGFSSLLAADVNHRFLADRMELTCVEPYPREFLKKNIPGLSQVIEEIRVLFGCKYAETFFPQEVQTALNLPTGRVFGGGSFWFEKTG